MTELLTIDEARRRLKVSRRTLYRLIEAGRIRVIYPRPRCPRITERELEAYIASIVRAA